MSFQNGRPAPILPDRPATPDEYRERGNPNLDSDSATVSSRDIENIDDDDDGVCSMPDTASEASDAQDSDSGAFHVANQMGFSTHDQGLNSRSQNTAAAISGIPQSNHMGFYDPAQQMQLLSQMAAQVGLAFPYSFAGNGAPANGAFNLPSLSPPQQQTRALHPGVQNWLNTGINGNQAYNAKNARQNMVVDAANRHGLEIQDEVVLSKSKLISKNKASPKEKQVRLKEQHGNHHMRTNASEGSQKDKENEHHIRQKTDLTVGENGDDANNWIEEDIEDEEVEQDEVDGSDLEVSDEQWVQALQMFNICICNPNNQHYFRKRINQKFSGGPSNWFQADALKDVYSPKKNSVILFHSE